MACEAYLYISDLELGEGFYSVGSVECAKVATAPNVELVIDWDGGGDWDTYTDSFHFDSYLFQVL